MLRAFLAPAAVTLITGVAAAPSASSSQPAVAPTLIVDGEAAMVTIAVRPDRTADFDRLLEKTKTVLGRSKSPQRQAQAAGWQVFKSEEMVQGSATYLMRLDPALRGADYGFAAIMAEESASEEAEAARLLRDIVIGQSVIALNPIAVPGLGGPPTTINGTSRVTDAQSPVLSFDTAQAAIITVLVRPDREADFTAALDYLGKSLSASRATLRQRQASGWKVLKGTAPFGANTVYVMSLDPVVPQTEYDLIRLIQEGFPNDVDSIFQRYRGAFVGRAVSRLTGRVDMSR
jgi:hypothetical protein